MNVLGNSNYVRVRFKEEWMGNSKGQEKELNVAMAETLSNRGTVEVLKETSAPNNKMLDSNKATTKSKRGPGRPKGSKSKRGPGRPKGRKNKRKT